MFAIISNSLTASISRFITYELGVGGNKDQLRKVFFYNGYYSIAYFLYCYIFYLRH